MSWKRVLKVQLDQEAPPGNLEIGPEKENAGNAKTC
jgi:hypothetical protein